MLAAWKKKWWHPKRRVHSKDGLYYSIASDVIEFTERVLKEYAPHEGIVYWAGIVDNNKVNVSMGIAPKAKTHEGQFIVDHLSNAEVILCLHEHSKSHIGQVHSHPGWWVDHSGLDDTQAAFKKEGLLSLVVPSYGKDGMLPLISCGVHRYRKRTFVRLANKYVTNHFHVVPSDSSILIDLRYGNKKS